MNIQVHRGLAKYDGKGALLDKDEENLIAQLIACDARPCK